MAERTANQLHQVTKACVRVGLRQSKHSPSGLSWYEFSYWKCDCCGWQGDKPQYPGWGVDHIYHIEDLSEKDWEKHVAWAGLRGLL